MLFDRSWYNRAGVERVMGFCTDDEYDVFLRQAPPQFEQMLIESGFSVTKLWFSVTRAEQRTRFAIRQIDPSAAGNCPPPWTSSPWTAGTPTPRPRRR